MVKDGSRYGWEKLDEIERYLAEHADKHAFSYRPWNEYGMSEEELSIHVRSELGKHGFWHSAAEMVMGSGMEARINLMDRNGEEIFKAIGGPGMTIAGEYRSLER